MRTIQTAAVITSLSSRQDRSARLSIETPEYTDEEFTALRELQGANVELTIKPTDEPSEELKIDKDLEDKPRHVRLRNVLYVFWEQNRKDMEDFETFYKSRMDRWIDDIKAKLV